MDGLESGSQAPNQLESQFGSTIYSRHAISPKFPAQVIIFMLLSLTKQEIGKSPVFSIAVALFLRLSVYNQLQSNPIECN